MESIRRRLRAQVVERLGDSAAACTCESKWQVADVRRPRGSASHIIQAGNDLFIGKDEAHIINRKKKEKSMLRKEGNV